MRWFDGHLDLSYVAQHGRDLTRTADACGGSLQPASLTFPALRAGGVRAIVSTLFVRRRVPGGEKPGGGGVDGPYCFDTPRQAFTAAQRQRALYEKWERERWIEIATPRRQPSQPRTTSHGPRAATLEPLRVVLAIEGAACIRDPDDLHSFHEAGVRIISLAWAEGSPWAGGDQSGGDITPAGCDLIRHLDRLHCIHDVSHLSEKAFWTLMAEAQGPRIASHSNCRVLLPGAAHPERHLSDEQIRALAEAGGIVGINLFARFLIPAEELKRRRATLADVLAHMKHMEDTAGRRDFLALGSDTDSGFDRGLLPADLDGPEHLHRLAEALAHAGWSDAEIECFAWGNWARLLL